jgi:hypothetical protein
MRPIVTFHYKLCTQNAHNCTVYRKSLLKQNSWPKSKVKYDALHWFTTLVIKAKKIPYYLFENIIISPKESSELSEKFKMASIAVQVGCHNNYIYKYGPISASKLQSEKKVFVQVLKIRFSMISLSLRFLSNFCFI